MILFDWQKREPSNRNSNSIASLKITFPNTHTIRTKLQQTFATFCHTPMNREWKYSLSSHWNAQLPAVVLSTVWTWLAVSRLSQHCALHMKQDMGLYPLGEFTSSGPPPPPLPHLPPETSGPFSWRPDIPSSSGGFSGVGVVQVKGEVLAPAHKRMAARYLECNALEPNIKTPQMTKISSPFVVFRVK